MCMIVIQPIRSDSAAAVGAKRGSAARHWRSHHAGTEAASLAACEKTDRLEISGADVQVSTRPHHAVSIG